MEAKYAVIIIDEFMSGAFAGLEVREAWHTLKTHCTQPASVQQLKAEIAAAVAQFDACNRPTDFLPWLRNRIDKWRQLSAV